MVVLSGRDLIVDIGMVVKYFVCEEGDWIKEKDYRWIIIIVIIDVLVKKIYKIWDGIEIIWFFELDYV